MLLRGLHELLDRIPFVDTFVTCSLLCLCLRGCLLCFTLGCICVCFVFTLVVCVFRFVLFMFWLFGRFMLVTDCVLTVCICLLCGFDFTYGCL